MLVTRYTKLADNCCLVRTQHNFCTQQLRYVDITVIVILFGKSCVQKVRTNSFQEVLEAVLFGGWSIPPTAHGWFLCGSPTRVSMMFIFICGKDIVRIDMYIEQCVSLVFLFWGELGNFCPSWLSRVSGSARRNLSPTWKTYLGMVVCAVRA